MNVERFSFRELNDGAAVIAIRGGKPFMPSGKVKEDAPPPPPTFSEEQLKAAERAAHQKGFLEGEQEGRKQAESEQAVIERKLAEVVEKFASCVQPLFEDYRKMALALQEQSPKMALAIARKVAGHALAQNAQAVIDEMAFRCCETMTKEQKLTITVHESLGGALTHKLELLAAHLQSPTDIVVLRDPNMPLADCRIEWNQGGMERQTAQIWQQVERMIGEMAETATRDTQEHMENLWAANPVNQEAIAQDPSTSNAETKVNAKPNPAPSPGDAQDATPKE